VLWVLLSYPAKTLILGGGFRNRRCWQNGWHANVLSTIIYKPVADSTSAWHEGVLFTFEEIVPPTIRLATEGALLMTNSQASDNFESTSVSGRLLDAWAP
jgi:hypothetical protein